MDNIHSLVVVMVNFTSGLWLYGTLALFAILLYMLYLRLPKFNRREAMFIVIGLMGGLALFGYENVNFYVVLGLELGILTFNGLLNSHSPKMRVYYVIMSLFYFTLLHWVGLILLEQALLIGLLSSITNIKEYKSEIENRELEIERDIVHILAGIGFMLLFYLEPVSLSVSILIAITIFGILLISIGEIYRRRSSFSALLYRFERRGTGLGHGALWLALGAFLPVAFLPIHDILIVYSAIFIADPVATIVGVYLGGKKLPYNSKKSMSGTFAHFITTTILSSLFVGIYGIIIGAVASIVESMRLKLDDNFTVSLALVILILLLGI